MRAITCGHAAALAERRIPAQTEAEFQRVVVGIARDYGWGVSQTAQRSLEVEAAAYRVPVPPLEGIVFHPGFSIGSERGWPDLTLVRRRDRRLLFAELKSASGTPTKRQLEVLDLLRALETPGPVRIEVFLWRPADLATIHEVLR